MTKWAVLLCIAMLSASCNSLLTSKPSGTLSETKMVDILVDIHLTEAALKTMNDSLNRLNDTTGLRIRFAQVFRKHDVEPDEFNTSLDYYIEHIEDLDKIYVEVINRLTEMEATLQQKPVNNNSNLKSLTPGQLRILNKNPWFRSLNKDYQPEEIQYFDYATYPVQSVVISNFRGPLK
jgi:hypothetical protein